MHYAAYCGLCASTSTSTKIFQLICLIMSGFGIISGSHKLFCHRSYTANKRLRALLIFFHTISANFSVYTWARFHRSHHKWTDTNADITNVKRGFLFSHGGWMLTEYHPEVEVFAKKLDCSDMTADRLIMFQHKYFYPVTAVIGFLLPTWFCWFFFGESFLNSWNLNAFRYLFGIHQGLFSSSLSHFYGNKPYDK